MNLPPFQYERPQDLVSALEAVAEGGTPYCGGTELLAAMSMGLLRPERLTSLRLVPELRGIVASDGWVTIGATMTHREVAASEHVRSRSPLLAFVAGRVGNSRVRATGTVAGNLAFAEPKSDLSTALVALGANVVLGDGTSTRTVTVADFIRGPYEADLRSGELLLRVDIPGDATDVAAYRKMTVTERPVVGVAVVRLRQTQTWRVVVGAVGEQPLPLEVDDLAEVDAPGIAGSVDVTAEHGASAAYKRRVTEVTIRRCCEQAREQCERNRS